ncbi:MAG: DEAD/DEAH box helicase [Desulfatiglandaceae bacterium]
MEIETPDISRFVADIEKDKEFGEIIVHEHYVPPREAAYSTAITFSPEITRLLHQLGLEKLYTHQVEAIQHLRRGKSVLVSTPTASGKSLIYNLAVLEEIFKNRQAKALYLFPLKALEQDQLKTLIHWIDCLGMKDSLSAEIYDGDTTAYRRKKIRTHPPQILFTNPDMLHRGILPHHQSWEALFRNLSFVVLDEIHTYRGIFGSHMNQVIRRLKRICSAYGSNPRFILSSATVSNPKVFGENLTGEPLEVVQSSGSPRSGQHFLFMNPVSSANFIAARLLAACMGKGFRTIAFTQSRHVTELIHLWVSRFAPSLRKKVSSYRAGFLPQERRGIERKLADGSLLGVVSTSALEMGIDIGYLDICLLVGYPGTIINAWQRGGRVGRSERESLVVLLAKPDALDQYFMKHPDDFFGRSFEAAVLDPHNPYVTRAHLPCAAAERPLTMADQAFWPEDLPRHLEALEEEDLLNRTVDGEPAWFSSRRNPQLHVDIRSGGESYTIFEKDTGQAVGTVDGIRAFKECHPGAIYLHRARQYVVERLILDKKDIVVGESDLKYFTHVRSEKETEIIEVLRSMPKGQFVIREGRLKVTEQVTGYEKRAIPGQELMGVFPLDLPLQTFETIGFWIEIEEAFRLFVERKGLHFMGGIHAIEHASIGIFPLFALCDRNDIGGICYPHHPQVEKGAIFIYDGHAGGVGLAQRGYEMILELLEKTLDLVKNCECEEGCPSCIHSPKCGSGNKPLDKEAALWLLECLLGHIPMSEIASEEGDEPVPLPELEKAPAEKKKGPRVIYLDLETQKTAKDVGGWNKAHLMRVSVAVLYDSLDEQFHVFQEEAMAAMFALLKKADLIVGFNIKGFDYKVLSAYTPMDFKDLRTFDILEDVHRRLGFRLSLDHLAKETLKRGKTAEGLQAVEWFREGEMEKLTEYCRQDVVVTRDLFQFGLEKGHVIYREKRENRRLKLRVDWDIDKLVG